MPTKLQINGKLKFYSKPYGRQWKWRYQTHGRMFEFKLRVPPGLENKKIIDPLHPETVPKPESPKWTPPRRHPLLESFFPQLTIKDHQHYHEQAIKLADKALKFHAGIDQVSHLTKSKAVQGLPGSILNALVDSNLADEVCLMMPLSNFRLVKLRNLKNVLVKSYIKQALAFHAAKEKCPGFKPNPNDPKFNIGTEYGTPKLMQMQILTHNLLKLCDVNLFRRYPDSQLTRKSLENVPISTIMKRGDDLIQIKRNADFAVFSKTRVPSVATDAEIEQTVDHKFIDMYPIFPTIDLKNEHIYDLNEPHLVGFKQPSSLLLNEHIHTIFHLNEDDFSNEADVSRLIMFAFGSAYAQAQLHNRSQKLEYDSSERLKNPIVVNAVSLRHERFNFVTFQLNTLNLRNSSGVKNIAYYDADNLLYLNRPTNDKLPYPSLRNIQRSALRHLEYNPETFKKLLAVMLFGASAHANK